LASIHQGLFRINRIHLSLFQPAIQPILGAGGDTAIAVPVAVSRFGISTQGICLETDTSGAIYNSSVRALVKLASHCSLNPNVR
jgi:hypothetical protein